MTPAMNAPGLLHLCDLKVDVAAPIEMGQALGRRRRIIPIVGGTVTGERIRGDILNLGADWQTLFNETIAELDTRYALRTHDGAIIEIRNFGYRVGPPEIVARLARGEDVDPALYYMRTHPRFETGDPRYAWLNRTICVGTGMRRASSVHVSVFEVL
jgi:hypothetical protein